MFHGTCTDLQSRWNGRQKLPLGDMREKVSNFIDQTIERKMEVDEEIAGLNYRDVVLVAGKMLGHWAGTIVPAYEATLDVLLHSLCKKVD